MPESQQPVEGERLMVEAIKALDPIAIVDVGAGSGKWSRVLGPAVGSITAIHAIEVWEPYVQKFDLWRKYHRVHLVDAREFERWDSFDVAIMGDVLEHMPRADATKLVDTLRESRPHVFLTIPVTECIQDGTVYGNPFETHVDQWSHEELLREGWLHLHTGPNPNGLVQIGTYRLAKKVLHVVDQLTNRAAWVPYSCCETVDTLLEHAAPLLGIPEEEVLGRTVHTVDGQLFRGMKLQAAVSTLDFVELIPPPK